MTQHKRQQAYQRGKYAEILALLFLLCKAYRPLAWRKQMVFEADLLMKKNNVLVLVEVKYRDDIDDALMAIDAKKLKRLEHVALMAQKQYQPLFKKTPNIRIDAVLIGKYRIRHIKNITLL
ncbi:MAG: YraN family protein [Alphaproteobacteria bacterium]|nr:YraN family protein [Alphaproteobacteria bacterium]